MCHNTTTADQARAFPWQIPAAAPAISIRPLNLDGSTGPAALLLHFGFPDGACGCFRLLSAGETNPDSTLTNWIP